MNIQNENIYVSRPVHKPELTTAKKVRESIVMKSVSKAHQMMPSTNFTSKISSPVCGNLSQNLEERNVVSASGYNGGGSVTLNILKDGLSNFLRSK